MKGYIHSVQTFGTVDGPGIRYVVFMQGCPMRCLYCHNPDTWEPNVNEIKTTDEIIEDYQKYKEFLKNGGLTVTGGEPLLQIDFVIDLFKKAKEQNIHTCIDTSGITFNPNNENILKKFDELMKHTDLVMLDIKHIDPEEHLKLTQQSNENILKFAKYLDSKKINLWIRHVVVPNITDKPEYLFKLGEFIGTLSNLKALDVLPYHNLGEVKYENLEMEYPLKGTKPLNKEDALAAKKVILEGIKKVRGIS